MESDLKERYTILVALHKTVSLISGDTSKKAGVINWVTLMFSQILQKILIHLMEDKCTMTSVILIKNPRIYSDVDIFGISAGVYTI